MNNYGKLRVAICAATLIGLAPQKGTCAPQTMKWFGREYKVLEIPKKGDVVMVFAHSDDELAAIGIAKQVQANGQRLRWIMVSDSAAGKILPTACKWGESPTACREREARRVSTCMGIDPPEYINLPDGGLDKVDNLDAYIAKKIFGGSKKVAAIVSHDARGIYGHPDHMAVHDASVIVAKKYHVPLIKIAVPGFYEIGISMRDGAKDRPASQVTHAIPLDLNLRKKIVCAHDSYLSQAGTLWILRKGLSPISFVTLYPLQFFEFKDISATPAD